MSIDYMEVSKQIDKAQVPGGFVLDSSIPRTDALAETELYARINDLCAPVTNSTSVTDSPDLHAAPDNHNEISTMIARGKFSPAQKSFKTMTILELHDRIKELHAPVGTLRKSFNRQRRLLGQALDEMRTRIAEAGGRLVIQEGQPSVNWDEYCTSIGENRRSASRWADNARTIRDAASNLHDAAEESDIDLYQPRTANILRLINQELNGRAPSEFEISALLDRLDPPDEPKSPGTKSAKRKSGNKRRKPVPPFTAPQPVRPESVVELRNVNLDFFKRNPATPVDDLFRPILRDYLRIYPPALGVANGESIAAILETELGFLREELIAASTPPEQTPEPSPREGVETPSQSLEARAEQPFAPTATSAPDTIADPTRKALVPTLPPGMFGGEGEIDEGDIDEADAEDGNNVDEEESVECEDDPDDIDEADVEEDDAYEEVDMEEDQLLEELPSFAARRTVASEYFEAAHMFFEAADQ